MMKLSSLLIAAAIIGVNIYKNDAEVYAFTGVLLFLIGLAFALKKRFW